MQSDHTTLYLRGLPRDLVRKAKAAAARRGSTLASFVREALERRLQGNDDRDTAVDDLDASIRWYERHRGRVDSEHAGEYVAILDGNVVDHDPDFGGLAARVFERFPERTIFMPLIPRHEPELRIRSPRRA